MTTSSTSSSTSRKTNRRQRPGQGLSIYLATACIIMSSTNCNKQAQAGRPLTRSIPDNEDIDYSHPEYIEWEDGPTSAEEFDHDNNPEICGLEYLTVEEWEAGKYWEKDKPVLVKNVTAGWKALNNWKKQEMLLRYPDAEATMGEARLVGETGPDEAGKNLQPTTVKEFITKHMYNPLKYFFDRKISIPKGMLEDCHPFPMPTRAYLENPNASEKYAPSKKKKVRSTPDRELWRDHLAISIGSDLQGLTFHHHREAWNVVLFGSKRWILWDHARWNGHNEMQWRLTRDWANDAHVTGAEWIRRLYPEPDREREIREFGHDCIQRKGDMMFVPHRWMHMVVNIGDTVSVISEVGLGGGEGLKTVDFSFDPNESSDDSEDYWSEDWSEDGPPPGWYRDSEDGPPPGWYEDSEDYSEDENEYYSED
mmetsp:Transcript_9213/g.19905  ORF Transcript_9213/g.19905 Transcript_9213/m.19905 type:complete len:423 (+) Transcript_9213:136-1404(+)